MGTLLSTTADRIPTEAWRLARVVKPGGVLVNVAASLTPARARKARKDGRDYLVAPASLIVPGILAGSQGPLYYPPDEVFANAAEWEGIPLVVYHPLRNGHHVSASTPGVYEESGVGFVAEPGNWKGKLGAYTWFDVEALRRVDPRVLTALEAGKPIELSTGLFTHNEPAPKGYRDHRGFPYNGLIARRYKPDHLAILPDQVGACSLNDGCGVLINTLCNTEGSTMKLAWRTVTNAYDKSVDDKRTDLQSQLAERFGSESGEPSYSGDHPQVVDLYDTYVVYGLDGALYRLDYTEEDGQCVLSEEEPVEVRRVTTYEPVMASGSEEVTENADEEVSPEKACEIIKDGTVHGNELTEAQRGYFGARCGEGKTNNRLTFSTNCQTDCGCKGGSGKTKTLDLNKLRWRDTAAAN